MPEPPADAFEAAYANMFADLTAPPPIDDSRAPWTSVIGGRGRGRPNQSHARIPNTRCHLGLGCGLSRLAPSIRTCKVLPLH